MCSIPPLGAINKNTNEYIYPAIANKLDKYICPDCKKDLLFRKGTIRIAHFAHLKDDTPCTYYTRPSESQIHKDAKMLLKSVLEKKTQITCIRNCSNDYYGPCKPEEYEIPELSETSQILIEYRFNYNGLKIADVAYIDNGELVCIFELCNTHKTEEIHRPEPWFEIDAKEFIQSVNSNTDMLTINCIRKKLCDNCVLVNCHRCNKLEHKYIMWTNTNSKWCKDCDIEYWNRIHLIVPFSDKDKIKSYGGRWDDLYKKWHIGKDSPQKELIVSNWKIWTP
jgi:hypothetical protein